MADLRAAFEEAGYAEVATYVQSGNVIFSSTTGSPSAVADRLEPLLSARFGFDLDIAVRTAAQLAAIARDNPLVRPGGDRASLHVAFLRSRPKAAAVRALSETDFGRDELVVKGSDIYLRYLDGVARSKMNTAVFERALGTPATVRTWKVVTRLNELARRP
jgi:uncharacterized protein (DUF1697 family)